MHIHTAALMLTSAIMAAGVSAEPWVVYEGEDGPGAGKHIVLVAGDEEYRSEEMLPQLGKILATHHGFDCTVLYPIDPETGLVDPNYQQNIPGLEALDDADLMIIFTRFRALPDEQMAHIDAYLKSGKPVMGIRTATHAFNFPKDSKWSRYSNGYRGDAAAWRDGFGRLVLGEKWVNHHGEHKHESTRGHIAPGAENHPVLRGVEDGAIWAPTDVYGIRLRELPDGFTPLVLGEVVKCDGAFDEDDLHFGMRPTDKTPVEGRKNDPMMPVVWTKPYQVPDGEKGTALMSTIGSSADFINEAYRRMLVNAAYWLLGMEEKLPEAGSAVNLVGDYQPTAFSFHEDAYWDAHALKPTAE